MKSKSILPLEKRDTASAKELRKALDVCEADLEAIMQSPLLPAYKAITKKIQEWSGQLEQNRLDIFDDEQDGAFGRSHKFFIELSLYVDSREKLLKQMSPEERELIGNAVSRNIVDPRKKD